MPPHAAGSSILGDVARLPLSRAKVGPAKPGSRDRPRAFPFGPHQLWRLLPGEKGSTCFLWHPPMFGARLFIGSRVLVEHFPHIALPLALWTTAESPLSRDSLAAISASARPAPRTRTATSNRVARFAPLDIQATVLGLYNMFRHRYVCYLDFYLYSCTIYIALS